MIVPNIAGPLHEPNWNAAASLALERHRVNPPGLKLSQKESILLNSYNSRGHEQVITSDKMAKTFWRSRASYNSPDESKSLRMHRARSLSAMPTCKAWKDIARSTSARRQDPQAFWGELAERELHWFQKWDTVLDWSNPPFAKWFYRREDQRLLQLPRPASERRARRTRPPSSGKASPATSAIITFAELHQLVCRFRQCPEGARIQGRRPLDHLHADDPGAAVAMLACARLGITHSVVFGGFSAEALKARIQDLDARLVITADGGWRRGKEVRLKPAVDEALEECPNVRRRDRLPAHRLQACR